MSMDSSPPGGPSPQPRPFAATNPLTLGTALAAMHRSLSAKLFSLGGWESEDGGGGGGGTAAQRFSGSNPRTSFVNGGGRGSGLRIELDCLPTIQARGLLVMMMMMIWLVMMPELQL